MHCIQCDINNILNVSGKYFLAAILLLVLSTIMTVVVLNAHHRAVLNIAVPKYIKLAILTGLAHAVFMRKTVMTVLKEQSVTMVGGYFVLIDMN